jgi:hypothetical protein
MMIPPTTLPVFDKFLDFLVEKASPQEILAFRVSEEEAEHLEELVDRNNAGTISPEEAAYLDQAVEFEMLVSVLKAKALKTLKKP